MPKILFLFIIVLIVSCSKNDIAPAPVCVPVEIRGPYNFVERYYYNTSNQMIKQTRSSDYYADTATYTYNSDGYVDIAKVSGNTIKTEYFPDHKIKTVTETSSTSPSTSTFTWYTDSLVVSYQISGASFPAQIDKIVFSGKNVVLWSSRAYTGRNLAASSIIEYSNFDDGINPYYAASLKRPGYSDIRNSALPSQNNPRKTVITVINYTYGFGQIVTENSVYTYNNSKAAVTQVYTGVNLTQNSYTYIYNNCN